MKHHGFSLVELSIVLVILGLLTGGILAGQSLIRAAELRSVSTEYNRYITATQTFRDKYFALPGDFTKATSFWGDDNAACPDGAIANGTPGTCNGNGDGNFGNGGGNALPENFRYWQHMALAGLIEGNYTGDLVSGNFAPGTNIPRSKLNDAVWTVLHRSAVQPIYAKSANFMLLSQAETSPTVWGRPLKPEEAWNIDTKMDDGRPGQGSVMGGGDTQICITPNSVDFDAAGAANTNADYNLVVTSKECRMWFTM